MTNKKQAPKRTNEKIMYKNKSYTIFISNKGKKLIRILNKKTNKFKYIDFIKKGGFNSNYNSDYTNSNSQYLYDPEIEQQQMNEQQQVNEQQVNKSEIYLNKDIRNKILENILSYDNELNRGITLIKTFINQQHPYGYSNSVQMSNGIPRILTNSPLIYIKIIRSQQETLDINTNFVIVLYLFDDNFFKIRIKNKKIINFSFNLNKDIQFRSNGVDILFYTKDQNDKDIINNLSKIDDETLNLLNQSYSTELLIKLIISLLLCKKILEDNELVENQLELYQNLELYKNVNYFIDYLSRKYISTVNSVLSHDIRV